MTSQGLVGIAGAHAPPLVGRREEIAFCEAVLARRDGTGVVITGASGVGKTRLATDVLAAADAAGYATNRATATEAGRAIPLSPFAHLLLADADPRAEPLQLLRAAYVAIAGEVDGRPLALLVDDAHLLDPASAVLVQQLVASRQATVIATVRTGEPAHDAVVALWKDHGCEYLELQPLSFDETGVLVESLVGGDVDGQTKHRLWEASRGVPLLVRELVLDGLERGLLVAEAGLWRWRGPLQAGGRLLGLIGARIGQLDRAERTVLELVVIGEPMAWRLLSSAEASAAEALMRRGLIAAHPAGRRLELRLAHPLFGESIRARMTATRASSVQKRLADVLETTGMRRPGDLLRCATWRLDSGGRATPEVFVRAADVAEWLLDSVLAERLARRAVDVGGGFQAERALARALIGQGRYVEAEAILRPLAARARTDAERTSAALARARNLLIGFGRGAEAEAAVAEAAAQVSDASLRRQLELVRSWVLSRCGRSAEAAALSSTLVAEAELADHEFALRAAGIAAHALVQAGRSMDALTLIAHWQPFAEREAGQVPLIETSPLLRAQYRSARFLALLHVGRLAEAEAVARDAYARSLGDGTTEATALMAMGSGLVMLLRGDLRAARRSLHEAVELLREADPSGSLPFALALTAQALGQAGDSAGSTHAAAEAEEARRPGTTWVFDADLLLGHAWAAAAEGALTEAQEAALEAVELAGRRSGLAAAVLAAHDLVRLGDAGNASARLTHLVLEVQGSLVTACAEHAEALLSGDAQRLERAASTFAQMGAWLWAAEAESAAARAHRDAGRETSARAAVARAALLLEHCEGARTPALARTESFEELTRREREIATLAAGGASNREIAARLVISVRTVENTLQRAYRKLGIDNRRELVGVLRLPE